jgi:uncharacterized membrane protein
MKEDEDNIFCSHGKNTINFRDKIVSCEECGQTQTFTALKQHLTPEEYHNQVESYRYTLPLDLNFKGWHLKCENTAKQIDPSQDFGINGEIIKEFWDLAPFSERVEDLICRESLEFELFQKGCTDFQWTPPEKELGLDLNEKLAGTQDYTLLFIFSLMGALLGFLLMFSNIWGLILLLLGLIFCYAFYSLQSDYTAVKADITREKYALQEIPTRVAQLKESWTKYEEGEKAKFKRFFQEMYPTKETDDLDAQFQAWKKPQEKHP